MKASPAGPCDQLPAALLWRLRNTLASFYFIGKATAWRINPVERPSDSSARDEA
jgi:hypothetical protein